MQEHNRDIHELRAKVVEDNAENKSLLNIILKLKNHLTEHNLKVQKLGGSSLTATTSINVVKIASNEILKWLKVDVT